MLRDELIRLPMPVYMMIGNHDNRDAFLKVFPGHPVDKNGFIQYSIQSPAGEANLSSYSGPNSRVHQTPFDFDYHRVLLYPDRVVVHARDFLHSEPRIIRGSCTEYPKP